MRKQKSTKLLILLWAVAVAFLARPTRQQDTGGLPASFFEPIGGGGGATPAGNTNNAGAAAGGTIPLDTAAITQPIGAGITAGEAAGGNAGGGVGIGADSTQPIGAGTTTGEGATGAGVDIGAASTTVNPSDPASGVGGAGATTGGTTGATTGGGTIPLDGASTMQPIGAGLDAGAGMAATDPFAAASTIGDPNAGFTPGAQIPVQADDESGPQEPPAPATPPGPPANWAFLPEDKQIIFGIEMHGPSLVPWTKTKSWNMVNTIVDTVLQSTDASRDIEVGVTDSYRKQVTDTSGPGSTVSHSMDSGIQMRLSVNTNSIRVESEVRSMIQAIQSGQLAKDLSIALGSEVSNMTLITDPEVIPYNSVPDPNASTGGSLPGWIIGAIVGGIIILIPIPAYLLYRRGKRKHIEALAKQQAEAAAARQRMQSRIIKSTGKSFSQGTGDFDMMESGEYNMNTPNGSISGRQMSANWMNVDASGRSFTPPPGYMGSPSPARALQQQHQRALYQSNSLGPGGLPQVNRVGSFTGQSVGGGRGGSSVYPVQRYSDSASLPSSSSGGGNI